MSDETVSRYSRHRLLPGFNDEVQAAIRAARVLIIGLGGLGSPAAMYLAAAGVGELLLCDFDTVDITNLQRQILYNSTDIGRQKTVAAGERVRAINPETRTTLLGARLQGEELIEIVGQVDVLVDGSDNFGTRYACNKACFDTGRPLVSGAAIRYEGQLTVFRPGHESYPCYACLYPESAEPLEDCRSNGILAPVVGVIGSLMATETLKLITGIGKVMCGELLRYNALSGTFRSTRLHRDPHCPVCAVNSREAHI